MARVLAVVSDLMLASRVDESLKAAGQEVTVASVAPDDATGFDAVVCDLDIADAAQIAALGLPALGFYQHTDVDTRRRAEEAGIPIVVPRSRMVRELPELVERLLADSR